MTDLQDLRARMRETRAAPSAPRASGEGFKIPFGVVAVVAVAAGFAFVTLTPKLYSVQRTAALPGLQEKARGDEPQAAAPAVDATPIRADYTGKSPEEAARLADAVCAQHVAVAKAQPRSAADDAKFAVENEKLSCFLSEGTARFCVPSQRRKATADVI